MGMFRLDIKKNILMKREGSHVGDVLIKMSERPGHCCAPPARLQRGYKQGRAASGGLEPGLLPVCLPSEKTPEVGHGDDAVYGQPGLLESRRHLSYSMSMGVWGSSYWSGGSGEVSGNGTA